MATQESKHISRHINKLLLDPNNYRFIDRPEYVEIPEERVSAAQVQLRTRTLLIGKNKENIKDLINSFRENGFLPVDQIQVKELANDNYLVLEGNRRIATLKYLYEESKNSGLDAGKLEESDFKSVPLVLQPPEELKKHLVVMGLKHISGNKKWKPVNQAQLIEDLIEKHEMEEEQVCKSLGISKHALRRARRTLSLINEYKKSDHGNRFESSMYTIFEEVVKRIEIKKWFDWDDEEYLPRRKDNQERLFSWISQEEITEYKEEDEEIGEEADEEIHRREPIITKSNEIRELAKFIRDEKALRQMEESRSITHGFALSEAVGQSKFNNALNLVKQQVQTIFNFSEHMKSEDTQRIMELKDKLDRLIPSTRAKVDIARGRTSFVSNTVSSHFSEITLTRFRRLKGARIRNLKRINIFAGNNNSGKTSILEAVYLLTWHNNIHAFFEVEKYRGKFEESLNATWFENNFLAPVELEAVFNGKRTGISITATETEEVIDKSGYLATLELSAEYDGIRKESHAHLYSNKESEVFHEGAALLCKSVMTSPYRFNEKQLREAHASAVENKVMETVVDFIRSNIDPAIEKIEIASVDNISRFFVSSENFNKSIDITNYGEGVQRVFEIALFFAYARNGVMLIDEFESAIHKSLLINFSKFVQQLAEEFNVQVFLTSHSKECIDAFVENDYKTEDITAYRLLEEDGAIKCKYTSGERLARLIDSIDVDIREGN